MSAVVDELAASALLGTARRAPTPPEASGMLEEVIASLPWSERPEEAVLQATAGAVVHTRAGAKATRLPEVAQGRAPDEHTPVCPIGASRLLEVLIADPEADVLVAEWLERVASRGERAHPVALPALLERATSERAERHSVLLAGGARLRWLAALEDRWSWAATPPSDATAEEQQAAWDLGGREARIELLRAVREADPRRARQLVARTWDQDPPEQRAWFIDALCERLSGEDEPLLERALDDGRAEVRGAAAVLLASLEGSAFRERMRRRLLALVRIEGRLRRRIDVTLPDLPDAAARRDGVRATRRGELGERAAALSDIVAGAGLSAWNELTGAAPAGLVALARGGDQEAALRAGWRVAALREHDAAWCAALAGAPDAELLAVIAPADDAGAARIVRDAGAARLLAAVPGPWGAKLSAAAVEALAGATHGDRGLARMIAARVQPDSLGAMLELVVRHQDESPSAALGTLQRILHQRQALIEELPLR